MEAHNAPDNLDKQRSRSLHPLGRTRLRRQDGQLMGCLSLVPPFKSAEEMTEREYREQLDDFAAAHVGSADELRRQFTDHSTSGARPTIPRPPGRSTGHGHHRLNPIFSSDVGHFDVTDMSESAGGGPRAWSSTA